MPTEVIVSDGEVTEEVAHALARRVSVEPQEYAIFIRNTVVKPGARALIETHPLSASRFATRILVIPSTIGANFLVHDIFVEGKSQIVENIGGLPAVCFSETVSLPSTFSKPERTFTCEALNFDVCPSGGKISIVIENTSKEPQRFCGCFLGRIVD